jgi:hypothetical protein
MKCTIFAPSPYLKINTLLLSHSLLAQELKRQVPLSDSRNICRNHYKFNVTQSDNPNNAHTPTPWSRVLLEKLTVYSARKKISCLLHNPKVHYHIHKSPSPVPVLSQMNPTHTLQPYFPKIHFNILG